MAAFQASVTSLEPTAVVRRLVGAVGGVGSVAGSKVEAVTGALAGPRLPRVSLARTVSV